MYVRFVLLRSNEDSGARDGFFSAAYSLRDAAETPAFAADTIRENLKWFEKHLCQPERLNRTKSKGFYRRATKGISWFKPNAKDHIARAFELRGLLEQYGFAVEVLKTEKPGYVVSEDDYQIVAEPFADTKA